MIKHIVIQRSFKKFLSARPAAASWLASTVWKHNGMLASVLLMLTVFLQQAPQTAAITLVEMLSL